MESGHAGASREAVVVSVSDTSDVFHDSVLAPLQRAHLYEESRRRFSYTSAVLLKNELLEEKYNVFRAKRKREGCSDEDLKETFGFLLFDDPNKAHALGETGLLVGNSTCTTLGDPRKGVYISRYSDCLGKNLWYHGKSGYIAIVRLTKGRVKKVSENFTQNFTAPTVGFDCHVSENLHSISATTNFSLAFERTQYYMYEHLDDGSDETAQSPSAACPFAVVSFLYMDNTATLSAPQLSSEEKKLPCNYLAWRGQLQIGSHRYDVGLRSTAGAFLPAKLPPVVKVDRALPMLDLIQLLPRTAFETCFSGEVFLDGLYFSLCELVPSDVEETNSLSLLLQEIKKKDIALLVPMNDGGFLILLHSSYFFSYHDTGSNANEVLQGMFIFPSSRVIQEGVKSEQQKASVSSEFLQVLPVLNYAQDTIEKTPFNSTKDLCEVLTQQMHTAALINPGLASNPSKEVSIFPCQYDVPVDHKRRYLSPEWTNKAWQSLSSYLNKPVSFQLPVSKASEILAIVQEDPREDLDDYVYTCMSSPEEEPAQSVSTGLEDQWTGEKSGVGFETMDSFITTTDAQTKLTGVTQSDVPDYLHAGDETKNKENSDPTVLVRADDMGPSDDLSAELIVSITSAERTVTDESLSRMNTMSAMKHEDFPISAFSAVRLKAAGVTCLHNETVQLKSKVNPAVTSFIKKGKGKKLRRGHFTGLSKKSIRCVNTLSLHKVKMASTDNLSMSQTDGCAKESSGDSQTNNPSNINWKTLRRQKRKFGKLSSKNKKVRRTSADLAVAVEKQEEPGQQSLDDTISLEPEICPLRKKTNRWDLKPVVSECGRILVPHGAIDVADQIKSLKENLQDTKAKQHSEIKLVDDSVNNSDRIKMPPESSTEMAAYETKATTSKDGTSNLNNEHILLKHYGIDSPPSDHVKEKQTIGISSGKFATKGDYLLRTLRSVLLRGKRKNKFCESDGATSNTSQNSEPCLKKSKGNSDADALKSNHAISSVQDTSEGVKKVSQIVSVDPHFAYALGLTPKEKPNEILKSDDKECHQGTSSLMTQEQNILNKQQQIIQRPPPIFQRRSRVKTLTKHQGVSAENVKKKWWLHFQTPAYIDNDRLKNQECNWDISVRKTVKEKNNTACSSTEALNLLADLALSGSNDLTPPPPPLERKPETSLKKCGLTKDFTTVEQESVLHALLSEPTAKSTQSLASPSPAYLVGDTDFVGLISEEHAYSLPSSSSLLLGLPGIPFTVSPLCGYTKLLQHHHQNSSEIQTIHPTVCQEERGESNHRTQESLKKHVVPREEFRCYRTFVSKDGSIQVTRQWIENYDFKRDSKFACDSKGRAIIRALHGPWDFSIQVSHEEIQLTVHMWIGLFYSRATPRLFHLDSTFSNLCPKESDSPEMTSEKVSAQAQSEPKANSFDTFPGITDTKDPSIPKSLDFSKENHLDQGIAILDLSIRNKVTAASNPQINQIEAFVPSIQKEASEMLNTLKSSDGQWEAGTSQCHKTMENPTPINNEVNGIRSHCEEEETALPSQKGVCLLDIPSVNGVGEELQSISIRSENVPSASGIDLMLHGDKEKKKQKKDENAQRTNISSVQTHASESSESMTDTEVSLCKESDNLKSENGENWKVRENPTQECKLFTKVICPRDDSANKELDTVCSENPFKNQKLSMEEPTEVPGKSGNINEVDFCLIHEHELTVNDGDFGRDEDYKKDSYHDSHMCADVSALTDQSAISEEVPHTQCGVELGNEEPVVEKNIEKNMCFTKVTHCQKITLPISDETAVSLKEYYVDGFTSQKRDRLETGSKNTILPVVFGVNSDHPEDGGEKIVVIEGKENMASPKESFYHLSHSPQCEGTKPSVEALTEEADFKMNINEELGKSLSGVVNIEYDLRPQGLVEAIEDRKGIACITKTANTDLPTEVCSTSVFFDEMQEFFTDKVALLDLGETNQPAGFGSLFDDRCPTPTLDEKQYECIPCSGFVRSTEQPSRNIMQRSLSRTSTPVVDEMPFELHICHESQVHSDHKPLDSHHPDLELRVISGDLHGKDKYLSISDHSRSSIQFDTKNWPHPNSDPSSKHIPPSADLNKKINHGKPAVLSDSTSPNHFLISPLKCKLEDALDVRLKPNRMDHHHISEITEKLQDTSVGNDSCQLYGSVPSSEWQENAEMDQQDCAGSSTSEDYKDNSAIDDPLNQKCQSSLIRTVYNTSQTRSCSLLDQVSLRGLQNDLTQASMEQECLIFSEQMKQLLKRSKRGPISQEDAHDKFRLSCTSPMILDFSSLEEQEESLDILDAPSLAGVKIKVDMSNRKDVAVSTNKEKIVQPPALSPGTNKLKNHDGISSMTAKSSRLYKAMMDDVCAVKTVPYTPKHLTMNSSCEKCFDVCDQSKQEMIESIFQCNLNSVVKNSSKTKYRFYIFVTSDDDLFKETKAHLESLGHTAIQPSDFFLGEGSSSSLLIIIRNEDISEHVCKIPYLLELKKAPCVQFLGIDELHDVVNLTYQELFTQGGFIMFDKAALEALSLCDMQKCKEILHELRKLGKWKWVLHYRDSRQLKENARLSEEAKKKKDFLNICQDSGLLEVLPYHECDRTSRDLPDYLTCLVRLQVQNISARFPVFITDAATDGAFGRNGILTITMTSFLTNSSNETF